MSHGAVAVHAAAVPAFHAASKAAVIMPPPSSSRLYSVGSNACSFALRSLHDTKETFLMVCISFLDALDALQTKLHLSTSLVKELKRVLSKMVDRSLTRPVAASTHKKMMQAQSLGEAIAASDAWHDVAKPDDVKGFVHWLVSAMRWINELALAGTVGVYRRVCILVMSFPGVPTACGVFCRIFDLVEHTLQSTLGYGANNGGAVAVSTPRRTKRAKHAHYMDNSSLTAVVLEYREKECMVPVNINRRIQQFMHFEIPLRSFEATVRLRSSGDIDTDDDNDEDTDLQQLTRSVARGRRGHHITGGETTTTSSTNEPSSSSASSTDPSSSSPRSIPASPRERRKFNLIYGNYFDNVLYEARDKLRLQRAVSLTGETQRKIPRFNKSECAQEVHLTCGRNCAVKEGPGMYRSVRGTVPILRNRYVYFEMKLSSDGLSSDATRQTDVNACIGIAPRSMPLNCLVGTSRNSVGLSSVGQILLSGQYRRLLSVSTRFGCPSTVGVLVFICDEHEEVNSDLVFDDCNRSGLARADVQFSVNGSAVLDDDGNILITSMVFPAKFDMYPTLSLHTEGLRVYAQFSSPDIATFNPSCFALSVDDADEVVCLDGLKVPRFQ